MQYAQYAQPTYAQTVAPAVQYQPQVATMPAAMPQQQMALPSVGSMIAMPQQYQFSAQPQPAATAPAATAPAQAPVAPAAPAAQTAAPAAPAPKKKRAVETKKKRKG